MKTLSTLKTLLLIFLWFFIGIVSYCLSLIYWHYTMPSGWHPGNITMLGCFVWYGCSFFICFYNIIRNDYKKD